MRNQPAGQQGTTFNQMYLGKNAVGASFEQNSAGAWKAIAKKIVVPQAGLLASIDVRAKGDSIHAMTLMASLWDDNSGSPGKVINNGNFPGEDKNSQQPMLNMAMSTTDRWVSHPISQYVLAGTYWAVANFGGISACVSIAYDAGSGADKTATTNVTWTNDGFSWSSGTNDYSIRGSLIT